MEKSYGPAAPLDRAASSKSRQEAQFSARSEYLEDVQEKYLNMVSNGIGSYLH